MAVAATFLPLTFPLKNNFRQLPLLKYQPQLHYHTSAILASAIDTVTLPWRSRRNKIDMAEILNKLNVNGRKVAATAMSLPIPLRTNEFFVEFLDRIESRNLVTRVRSQMDKRRVSLYLTEQGKELLEKAPQPLQEHFIEKFSALAEWEQSLLLSSMQRVAAMMDADKLDASPLLEVGALTQTPNK
jgi:hypothetical protein